MTGDKREFIARRLASFKYAGRGVLVLLRTQFHARVHLLATVLVIIAGVNCRLNRMQWALISLSIGLVWTAEAINTAIEFLVDLVSPEHQELAGKAKDVAAGAVLLASMAAVGVAVAVFLN
jgi:diacylglycerol kinase (ATP)